MSGLPLKKDSFKAMLEWFMVSDPWPLTEEQHELIRWVLDAESQKRGYENWVVAYHEYR